MLSHRTVALLMHDVVPPLLSCVANDSHRIGMEEALLAGAWEESLEPLVTVLARDRVVISSQQRYALATLCVQFDLPVPDLRVSASAPD